jgi:hypothetical protein
MYSELGPVPYKFFHPEPESNVASSATSMQMLNTTRDCSDSSKHQFIVLEMLIGLKPSDRNETLYTFENEEQRARKLHFVTNISLLAQL